MPVKKLIPLSVPLLVALAFINPRAVEFVVGAVCLVGAASGLRYNLRCPPDTHKFGVFHPVMLVGFFGLLGSGSIAWGMLTAARVTAGCVSVLILTQAAISRREERDGEAVGCAVFAALFATTGFLGLVPTYFEQEIFPGTAAGQTVRGVSGYLLVWLLGLVCVSAAFAIAQRNTAGEPVSSKWRWLAAVLAALGFGVWLGGAMFFSGVFGAD
jgi:hypothetical protein